MLWLTVILAAAVAALVALALLTGGYNACAEACA